MTLIMNGEISSFIRALRYRRAWGNWAIILNRHLTLVIFPFTGVSDRGPFGVEAMKVIIPSSVPSHDFIRKPRHQQQAVSCSLITRASPFGYTITTFLIDGDVIEYFFLAYRRSNNYRFESEWIRHIHIIGESFWAHRLGRRILVRHK